jgi:hypothetical protein
MKFILKDTGRPTEHFKTKYMATRCRNCSRLTFILDGKNYAWVDGCHEKFAWVDTYVLSK